MTDEPAQEASNRVPTGVELTALDPALRPMPITPSASPPALSPACPTEVWINPPKTRAAEEALLH
jgi:hypothetical protein